MLWLRAVPELCPVSSADRSAWFYTQRIVYLLCRLLCARNKEDLIVQGVVGVISQTSGAVVGRPPGSLFSIVDAVQVGSVQDKHCLYTDAVVDV